MKLFTFTTIFVPERGKGDVYNVSVPALPEVTTFGTSLEEARFMAQDALELVVLSRLERGEVIPRDLMPKKIPKNAKTEQIVVSVVHQVSSAPATYVKSAVFQRA